MGTAAASPPAPAHVTLPLGHTRAHVAPGSINPEARTADLVWTTGARVRRAGWDGPWFEELSLDDAAVDLGRLNAGANLLAAHNARGLGGILGVVESAHLETTAAGTRQGVAHVRFSSRPDVEPVWNDVRAGIIRHVSVGYVVHKLDEVDPGNARAGEPPVFRASKWEPVEVSLLAVPADPGAHVRGVDDDDAPTFPCLVTRGVTTMGHAVTDRPPPPAPAPGTPAPHVRTGAEHPEDAPPTPAPTDPPADPPPPADEAARATLAERAREADIRAAVRATSLGEAFADRLVREGTPIADARTAVIAEMARRQAPPPRTVIDTTGGEGIDRMHKGLVNALLHRVAPGTYQLDETGREWTSFSLLEIGRRCLEARGVRTRGMGKLELAATALGLAPSNMLREGPHGFLAISDFPALLATIGRTMLTAGYAAAPRTFPPWTRQGTLPDFRVSTRVSLGVGPKFLPVPEHAEYERGNLASTAQPIKLDTFGRMLAFTRQAMINDDVGLFQRIPQLFGNSAAQMESDVVYGILTGNPNMSDGVPIFHATHGNLMAAASITVGSMALARTAMLTQKSPDGQFLSIRPLFLVVGPQQEVYALQFLAPISIVGAITAVVPEAYKQMRLVVEPRITGADWYITADPAQIDTIEYDYLEGSPSGGPFLETREGWDIDGQEFKAREEFGAACIDYRGLVHNPGVIPTGTMATGLGATASTGAPAAHAKKE